MLFAALFCSALLGPANTGGASSQWARVAAPLVLPSTNFSAAEPLEPVLPRNAALLPLHDACTDGSYSEQVQPHAELVLLLFASALLLAAAAPAHADLGAAVIAAPAAVVSPGLSEIWAKAGKRALGGGVSGALAGVAQVLSLMWLRTAMNYQYAADEKMSTTEALKRVCASRDAGPPSAAQRSAR